MRSRLLMVAFLALAGCGARNTLEVTAAAGTAGAGGSGAGGSGIGGSGGGGAPRLSRIAPSCAPADGPAIMLTIDGLSGCSVPLAGSAIQILVWGPALAGLQSQSGLVLMVGAGPNAATQAVRVTQNGQGVLSADHGTVVFTTFISGQPATGTYDLTYTDGTVDQGAFDAVWCPGVTPCGG